MGTHNANTIYYVYQTYSGRLSTMTDALDSVSTYTYNVDNTLNNSAYTVTGTVTTTPAVHFGYDTVYNRVT